MNYLDTPQRVFYLINNPRNVEGNRSLWDMKVRRSSDDRTLTTTYTEIVATKDPDDRNFSSVVVRATKVTDITIYDEDTGACQRSLERSGLKPTKWDELDDEIVGIIENFYSDTNVSNDLLGNQVLYADSIRDLSEYNNTVRLTVDEHGLPEVHIEGLPIDVPDEYEDDICSLDMTISSTKARDDYQLWLSDGDDEIIITLKELKLIMDKAKKFDEVYEYMKELVP